MARNPHLKCKGWRRQPCITTRTDCSGVIPALLLNEKGSQVPTMTKGNKTARRIRCNILLSFLLPLPLLPSSRTHKSRPAHKGCQVSAIRQSRDVCPIGVYCEEENEREREGGPGGAALSIRESFSLALSLSLSLSRPSARSEMAPMGSHESQIKWIVLVSFSPSSSFERPMPMPRTLPFPPPTTGGKDRRKNDDNGSIAATPHKASKQREIASIVAALHLHTLNP